jgi:hypothetical protein
LEETVPELSKPSAPTPTPTLTSARVADLLADEPPLSDWAVHTLQQLPRLERVARKKGITLIRALNEWLKKQEQQDDRNEFIGQLRVLEGLKNELRDEALWGIPERRSLLERRQEMMRRDTGKYSTTVAAELRDLPARQERLWEQVRVLR